MHRRSYYVVNAITLYRLIAAPFLLLLIINHNLEVFKWLLGLSFFTDAIDGYLARKQKVTSAFGSKLDSIADDLTVFAAIVGIIVFKPEFLKREIILISVLLTLFMVQMILAFIRYGKTTSFHTYAAKAAAILQGVFLLLFFFLPEPAYVLFYITVIVTMIDLVEEIIIVLTLPYWKTDVRGLYWVLKNRK